MFILAISCLTISSLPWFSLPNILDSYALLLFRASDFAFTTRHIHNWVLFLLSTSPFILTRAASNCPLLLPSSILDTFLPGGLIFQGHIFLPFYSIHGALQARILEWVAISFPSEARFVRTLHYDPSVLGGPCTAWLIASLSYAGPFAGTRLWSLSTSSGSWSAISDSLPPHGL